MQRATRLSPLLLVLTGCTTGAEAPASLADAPPDTGWWATVQTRLQAEDEAFFAAGEGFVATLPRLGLHARFDEEGVVFSGSTSPVRVVVAAWGRNGSLVDVEPGAPALGACGARTSAEGDCLPRLEYVDGELLTWWESTSAGFEQGWELSASPRGNGRLRIELATDATVEPADDGLWLVGADGAGVHVGEATAWDAAGVELDARIEATAGGFFVEVDDAGAAWPITIDPVYTTASTSITGSSSNDLLGYAVNGAGDVNHDNYADLIVGAPGYSSSTGRAYLFHGSSTGISTTASTTLTGPSSDASFGLSVAGAGDTNGDGYDDVIVGAPEYDGNNGLAYVYKGSSTGITTSGSVTISTSNENLLGFSVDGAGDVNNDGYDDVIVGQPYYDSYTGRARIYHGSSSGVSSTSATTLTVSGSYGVGHSVSAAGDVDHDGYADVVVGAPWYGYPAYYGSAFVFRGSSSGVSTTASTSIYGSSSNAYLGYSVAGGGDVNGDNYDDIVVGAPYYSTNTGRVTVYQGSSSGVSSTATTTITGASSEALGSAVALAGDTDNDGYDEIIVGAPYYSSFTGRAYLYPGASTGISSTASATLTGTSSSHYYGFAVAGAGDVNKDGYADVAVGAYGYDSYKGRAMVFHGYAPDSDSDGWVDSLDCDDANAAINPGATETCDGSNVDEDCDGAADDADSSTSSASKTLTRYTDSDGDAYGTGAAVLFCDAPASGYASTNGDCNDANAAISPGAGEVCDDLDVDEDCDGLAEDLDSSAIGKLDYYRDGDGDLYGSGTATAACDPASGWVETAGDCNDASGAINPGATEVCDAGSVDEDCDGTADDGDKTTTGQTPWYEDADNDGFGGTSSVDSCDAPTGWVATSTDCDDGSAAISPAASEVCDAADVDEDCDGAADDADSGVLPAGKSAFYMDSDGDAYGGTTVNYSCDLPSGYAAINSDCNDGDAAINPGATELCDASNTDEDCDGLADNGDSSATGLSEFYRDLDGDTFGAGDAVSYCDAVAGYVDNGDDCNDGDGTINPASVEICDPADVDEDCDGTADDADSNAADATKITLYADADADSYGSTTATLRCDLASGYVPTSTDCDDSDAAVHPGASEVCDAANADEDCDGAADDLDSSTSVVTKTAYYQDADGDSFGGLISSRYCDPPYGYETTGDDCDDADASVYPGAAEVVGDGIDQDCDGMESCYADQDGDGFRTDELVVSIDATCDDAGEALGAARSGDCDDTDAAYNPGASETDCGDPNDYNCDGAVGFTDGDGDGYAACEECDDANPAVSPAAQEQCDGDNVDEDCDGLVDDADDSVGADGKTDWYVDGDADGFGGGETVGHCDAGDGYTATSDDCDDSQAGVNPAAVEICDATDTDEDCDGLVNDLDDSVDPSSGLDYFFDADADDYGGALTIRGCSLPDGYAATDGDCDEVDPAINPGASEVCDELDNDCDLLVDDADDSVDAASFATWYADTDGDGYGDMLSGVAACSAPEGYLADGGDCDDVDPEVHPEGAELPADTIDGNCDGLEECYVDADGDGYHTDATELTDDLDCAEGTHVNADAPGEDCDDTDADFHPSAPEDCSNTIDYNCDGFVGFVDGDLDGWAACEECDDGDATINPDAAELCDGFDNNCDESVDGADAVGAVTWYPDVDEDGYTSESESLTACDAPIGYGSATASADCDDADPAVNPSATEALDDGVDQDCDGVETCLTDADEDGYRPDDTTATISDDMDCDDAGEGAWADPSDDCDDDDASVHPGAEDVPLDEIDQDCDGFDAEEGLPDDTGDKIERIGGLYGGGGCGCASGGDAAGLGLLVGLIGLMRRRR